MWLLCGGAACLGLLWVFHRFMCNERPKLFYMPTKQNKTLVEAVSLFHSTYVYPLWGMSGNFQSGYAAMLRGSTKQPFRREELYNAENESTVTVDWVDPVVTDKDDPDTIPTVIFIPGIAGSINNHYVKKQVERMRQINWRIAVYNHPGCGNSILTSPKIVLHGDTRDVRAVVKHVHSLYPRSPLLLLGISLGANLICRYLAEEGDSCPIRVAVSMAQGFEARRVLNFLSKNPLYDYGLVAKFKGIVKQFRHVYEGIEGLDLERALSSRSLSEFDLVFTQKVHRISSLDEYYDYVSSAHLLNKIRTPTLIVNARDDPLFDKTLLAYPRDAASENSNIIFCTTEKGGHATWAKGFLIPSKFTWGDEIVVEWFSAGLNIVKAK